MKILIADDDPITLDALIECIEGEGLEALGAANGQEAIELWRTHQPDLVCLDIMMPEISGYEVCRRIRQADTAVPILFLSAKNQEIDIVAGLDLGADDFIRKPFTRREVIARIHAALRRSCPPESEESFPMCDLTVFPDKLQARREEKIIELTLREEKMLSLLHEKRGGSVSRDAFLDACWGQDYFPDSRTLDQHISSLRKKIERDASKPLIIKSVRGIGYRMGEG